MSEDTIRWRKDDLELSRKRQHAEHKVDLCFSFFHDANLFVIFLVTSRSHMPYIACVLRVFAACYTLRARMNTPPGQARSGSEFHEAKIEHGVFGLLMYLHGLTSACFAPPPLLQFGPGCGPSLMRRGDGRPRRLFLAPQRLYKKVSTQKM